MNHPTEYAYVMNTRPLPLEPNPMPAYTCGLVIKVRLDAPAGQPIATLTANNDRYVAPIYRDGEGGPDAAEAWERRALALAEHLHPQIDSLPPAVVAVLREILG